MTDTVAVGTATAPGHRGDRQQSFSGLENQLSPLSKRAQEMGQEHNDRNGVGQGSL